MSKDSINSTARWHKSSCDVELNTLTNTLCTKTHTFSSQFPPVYQAGYFTLPQFWQTHVSPHSHSSSLLLSLFACVSIPPSPSGHKRSACVHGGPRFNQTGAFEAGPGSGGWWALARPPAGVTRRSQRTGDALRCYAETRLWTLSGNTNSQTLEERKVLWYLRVLKW